MKQHDDEIKKLQIENEKLKMRLDEAEETLRAIRHGEIDALVVKAEKGLQVYTLKGAEHTYRILIESMNEGAVTLGSEGTILYANKSFANLVNLPLEKVIGCSIQSFIAQQGQRSIDILLRDSQKTKKSVKEMDIQLADGQLLPVLLSITTINLDRDEEGFSLIITDLSEQKRNNELAASKKLSEQKLLHEQELRSSAETAAEALTIERNNLQKEIAERKRLEKQKDEFIGMASHELKTPVTSIKAYTQVLQHKFKKVENIKAFELLSKMDAQLDKLSNLISDLLDVTKAEAGKLQFHNSYFDINELVEEIAEEVQRTTSKHKIIVETDTTKSILGDRERIGQVMTNFLTNAIKYSPRAKKIVLKTQLAKDRITISVQDFGVGIPKKSLTKIFNRFYRVDGVKQETYPGLGLGLYISSEIVKRHNGTIWVESELGKGSVFSFDLPLKKASVKNFET